ncbi:PD40 domain-containing protein [Methylotetracoccus oryzae]|uniref:PD40 domain-containing protein n=1 Tax=Methylotetracoccus oryzae TaxID=1919059 RepID=UPI001117BB19|nr:PD40 domain-containing protein [Methylotetracoccus oryzae]
MKADVGRILRALTALLLTGGIAQAMPGMDMTGGVGTEPPATSHPMGGGLASAGSNFEITYSADGKTALFTSTRPGSIESGTPYNFDIWLAHKVNDVWQPPVPLGPGIDPTVGPNLNTPAWELEASFSDDGQLIYFTRYEAGNLSTGDLYVAQQVDGVWQPARNWNDVPELPHLNTATGEEHCPVIASDSLIYFNYQQPGVTQDSDVWKVEKKNGVWQPPQSLGPRLNSPYRDHLHWTGLSRDGQSLIVTSNRPDLASRGGHDEWIAYRNAKGDWQEPLNLGDTINTAGEDMCWTFTPDGQQFTGGWGPQGNFDFTPRWVSKNDIPLLKNFEPIGPPPNLLAAHPVK